MRAMAVSAIARRSRMLYLCLLDQFGLIGVARHAKRFCIGLRQHYFPVFRGSMTHVTLFFSKRRMHELGHQFGNVRLVRIVAGQAIRFVEGLILVRLLQVRTFRIVAVQAQGWGRLRQVKIKLCLSNFAGLMRNVARVATHIECGMTAALGRHIQSSLVATEAEVFFFPT